MMKKIFISLIVLTISAYGMENDSGAGYNSIRKLLTTHKQNNQAQVDSIKKKKKNRDPFLATKDFIRFDLNKSDKNKVAQDVLIDLNELPEKKEVIIISDDEEVVDYTDSEKIDKDLNINNLKTRGLDSRDSNLDNQTNIINAKLHGEERTPQESAQKIRFQCRYCTYSNTEQEELAIHIRGFHIGKPAYPCPFCNMERTSNYFFNEHIKMHLRNNEQPADGAHPADEQSNSSQEMPKSSEVLPQRVVLKYGNDRLDITLPSKRVEEQTIEIISNLNEQELVAEVLENFGALISEKQAAIDDVEQINDKSLLHDDSVLMSSHQHQNEEAEDSDEFLIRFATDEEIAIAKNASNTNFDQLRENFLDRLPKRTSNFVESSRFKKRPRRQINKSERFKCDYCEKDYAQLCSLNRHIRDKH